MTRTILIADDEEFIVDLLATLLEDEQYRVLRAYDGEEALRAVQRERPHLIITDVMMPKLTGTDLARRVRAGDVTQSATPIILMSAVRQPPAIPDTHYLAKPFDIDQVLDLVERLLG
jgi:DNA-binding response OmpR family regulator